MPIPMPAHLVNVPQYAEHQQWLLETYGYCRHTPPVGTVAKRADYTGMDMRGLDLSGAYLTGADLSGADLTDADLARARLSGAVLTGAVLNGAVLTGADLTGAVLIRADLYGADLIRADLSGANGLPVAPVVENLDAQILAQIENGGALEMGSWHTCETTHCRAGWAVVLAGADGKALEEKYGPAVAGALIYHASAGRIPNFYASNEDALADMRANIPLTA